VKRNAGRRRRYPAAQPQQPADVIEREAVWAWLTGAAPEPGPPQSRGPGKRYKSYCPPCDLVHRGAMTCLRCGGDTVQMGTDWRPGRKGSRTRVWDTRVSARKRGWPAYVPEPVRQLGVKGLPPRSAVTWWSPDAVLRAIEARGRRQRSRRRRGRSR
jgi:hypothetical protein